MRQSYELQKEPLQQGQTTPKNDAQQKQQAKKSKGMKVSS